VNQLSQVENIFNELCKGLDPGIINYLNSKKQLVHTFQPINGGQEDERDMADQIMFNVFKDIKKKVNKILPGLEQVQQICLTLTCRASLLLNC